MWKALGNPTVGFSPSYTHSKLSCKAIWSAKVPKRVKHFTWKLKHNAISTKLNLTRRRVARDSMCPVCKNEEESLEHLFLLPLDDSCLVWPAVMPCSHNHEYHHP